MGKPGEIRGSLLSSINRWEEELGAEHGIRPTLWYGIMDKCCKEVENLLKHCVEALRPFAGDAGHRAIQTIAGGKPVERMTLGEHVKVLENLDDCLTTALRKAHLALNLEGRLVGKDGKKLLNRISRMRSDFEHGRWKTVDREETRKFLTCAKNLCESQLLRTVIGLEQPGYNEGEGFPKRRHKSCR